MAFYNVYRTRKKNSLHIFKHVTLFYIADVNECAIGSFECSQNCHNTIGSYICGCDCGYIIDVDGRSCNGLYISCNETMMCCTFMSLHRYQ